LGGVYKLSAIRNNGEPWQPKLKLSEQQIKVTNPGILQVRRFRSNAEFLGDAIYDASRSIPKTFIIVDPLDATRRKHFEGRNANEDLLVPIFKRGRLVYEVPPLEMARERARLRLAMLHPGIKRVVNPHQYPAGLELSLHEMKTSLILKARGEISNPAAEVS